MPRPATGQVVERDGKSDTTFALRFRAYGKRQYVTLGTKAAGWTRAKAEAELRHTLADVERGIWQPPSPEPAEAPEVEPTFHEFASNWLASRQAGWKRSTIVDAKWALELHLLPVFKDYRLSEITAEAIDHYAAAKKREGKLTANSVNKTLGYLSTILETAVDYDKIAKNPARGKKRRLKAEPRSRPWVKPEQLMTLLESCSPQFRVLAATLAGAGLRVGEAVALRWRHVNLASGTLWVEDAKTEAGVREVELPTGLAEILRVHKARASKSGQNDPVFRMDRSGDPQTVRNAQQRMKPAIRKANKRLAQLGIEPISETASPHALRRSYSSIRFAVGDDPVWVSSQMGHRQVSFSMSVYAHAVQRRAKLTGAHAEEFDRAIEWARMATNHLPVPNVEPAIAATERIPG